MSALCMGEELIQMPWPVRSIQKQKGNGEKWKREEQPDDPTVLK